MSDEKLQSWLLAMVSAAMERIGTYPKRDTKKFQIEAIWLRESAAFTTNSKGFYLLKWRRFELGRVLFEHLCEAQNWRYCYCGVRTEFDSTDSPTLEHVIPISRGGSDHPDNLVMACANCNNARKNKMPVNYNK